MPLGEFELIDRYFRALGARRADVLLGVGDDAAVLSLPAGKRLVAATDTLVEAVHFPKDCAPRSIGHRVLAVNLSDLAAMGAKPAWATLALTMPKAEESWLAEFAAGLDELARLHAVALVGGDTTAGPLTVTLTLLGLAESGSYLSRASAAPGDHVFVSGVVGDGAAGLAALESRLGTGSLAARQRLMRRFLYPEPRVELGARLLGIASAAIDISDGVAADVAKLIRASGCGARIDVTQLPLSTDLLECAGPAGALDFALSGGDDYELCFTVPPERFAELAERVPASRWPHRDVGVVDDSGEVVFFAGNGIVTPGRPGYDHFAT
ncbi:MAG TPA: thiamine-phosphate kinase [Steroidobacteraceae bacterium]|nr:thiamine-phosphate kinase [Steroidobacteraceae bacterium]